VTMLKFDRPTLVTLTAPTASGKNYLRDAIEKKFGWQRIVSTTTRGKRAGEVEGEDYYFLSKKESLAYEAAGKFAELIEFRGVRYGVTHEEMTGKMLSGIPPMVILEPQGLEIYKKMCASRGWDIFTIYISVTESVRIQRLKDRTLSDTIAAIKKNLTFGVDDVMIDDIDRLIEIHTDRLLSITGDERRWSHLSSWDAILPGDDVNKALEQLEAGVQWRNNKNRTPKPFSLAAN
jgi:guanylate kinase